MPDKGIFQYIGETSDLHIIETKFEGLFLIENPLHSDSRGTFFKPFDHKAISTIIGDFKVMEMYFSTNRKHVVRGMHFQSPPTAHSKLVWVSQGSILDVVLDLRAGSNTFGKWFDRIIRAEDGCALLIKEGFAHGFLSLEEGSIVNYAQTTGYDQKYDKGVRFDTFGYVWPVSNPIVSDRDRSFPSFDEFETEFV